MTKNNTSRISGKAVTEALTLLTALKTNMADRLSVQFNVASHNLDQFVIKGRVHPLSPLETLYSTAGNFTAPTGLLTTCSGDLTAQAVDDIGSFIMDVGGYHQIEVHAASVHSAGSVVDIYTSLR